ncbi:MAG: selenide, water dikinase SelD [Rhizomicrobium sp.]
MPKSSTETAIRLTELAHGGGCGCKLAPSVLVDILKGVPQMNPVADLLVGLETSDDAAVYRINDDQAIVATTDFFMPIVDAPYDFGRIAACNALSDVFAMGARPIFALAIVGMPVAKIGVDTVRAILAGGNAVCTEAGIPIAGGHSIDSVEPIYGLVAMGTVDPNKILRNSTARSGDVLILTKRLGVGIFSAALKKNILGECEYAEMLSSMTQLNSVGAELAHLPGVHAMTDVTGFGLLGHALEMCRGSSLSLQVDMSAVPVFSAALELAERGIVTGASRRNWESYGCDVAVPAPFAEWRRNVLCDPQTSGGLLIACARTAATTVLDLLMRRNYAYSCLIGEFDHGPAKITISDG